MSVIANVARARRAFINWPSVCLLVGIGGPSALPPRDGWALLGRRRLQLRSRRGPVLETRVANASPVIEVFAYDEYGRLATSELTHVLDVGAQVGAFALWLTSANRAVSIVCVEPEPGNFADLVENIARNGAQARIEAINAAVAPPGATSVGLVVSAHSESTSEFATGGTLVHAPAVSLAVLLGDRGPFDLVKMDCEGAEWSTLELLDDESWSRIDRLVLECHATSARTVESMLALLEGKGLRTDVWSRGPSSVDWCDEVAVIWAAR